MHLCNQNANRTEFLGVFLCINLQEKEEICQSTCRLNDEQQFALKPFGDCCAGTVVNILTPWPSNPQTW